MNTITPRNIRAILCDTNLSEEARIFRVVYNIELSKGLDLTAPAVAAAVAVELGIEPGRVQELLDESKAHEPAKIKSKPRLRKKDRGLGRITSPDELVCIKDLPESLQNPVAELIKFAITARRGGQIALGKATAVVNEIQDAAEQNGTEAVEYGIRQQIACESFSWGQANLTGYLKACARGYSQKEGKRPHLVGQVGLFSGSPSRVAQELERRRNEAAAAARQAVEEERRLRAGRVA